MPLRHAQGRLSGQPAGRRRYKINDTDPDGWGTPVASPSFIKSRSARTSPSPVTLGTGSSRPVQDSNKSVTQPSGKVVPKERPS